MTVEPGITGMPERIGHDNRAGNDGAGWLSDHQPLPDCSGGFWAAEMLEDLEAEVDGAAGSAAGYDGSVGNGRGLDIFGTFCDEMLLKAVVAGETYSFQIVKLGYDQTRGGADRGDRSAKGVMALHEIH